MFKYIHKQINKAIKYLKSPDIGYAEIKPIKQWPRPDCKSNEIINDIEGIRILNNKLWMEILRISFYYSPEEAKNIFKQITNNDKKINDLSKELCK